MSFVTVGFFVKRNVDSDLRVLPELVERPLELLMMSMAYVVRGRATAPRSRSTAAGH